MAATKNLEYAGQLVDIARKDCRLSVSDCLKPMMEADGDPFLNVFSMNSIYIITLFRFEDRRSIEANLPLKDLPLIQCHTDLAEREVFAALNGMGVNTGSAKASEDSEASSQATDDAQPAFTQRFNMGRLAGKTPGDIILAASDQNAAVKDLLGQAEFLKRNLAKYPANQTMINAVTNAVELYQAGLLEQFKPAAANGAGETPAAAPHTLKIYETPVKHMKRKDQQGRNLCYSITVTCNPQKNYAYRIEMMNCYAPLGHLKNGMMPIQMDQAVDIRKNQIDLTEAEWLYLLDRIRSNAEDARRLWYGYARKNDEAKRQARMQQAV